MIWFPPRTWSANDPVTAARFNTFIRDNQKALIARCRATKSGVGSFGPSATQVCTFDAVTEDPLGMWSAALPTRITIPFDGCYRVAGNLGGSSATATQLAVYKNGALELNGDTGTGSLNISEWTLRLVTGDYLELYVTTGTSVFTLVTTGLAVGGLSASLVAGWVAP